MQPIAIGPIKYVTHGTIRYDWENGIPLPLLVCAQRFLYPTTTGGSWRSISDNLDGRTDGNGLGIDLSRRYINSFSVYITARSNARNQLLWSVHRGFLRCFHFSALALREVLFLFLSYFFLYNELWRNFIINFCYQSSQLILRLAMR